MKFGSNLNHLSIREWKRYNLDYNDLKYKIRILTQQKNYSVLDLHQDFLNNFNRVNLFIDTKNDELMRKLAFFEANFERLLHEETVNVIVKQINFDEIFYQTIEISVVLKKLLKFITIQKIACRKILKKFMKYYEDKKEASQFVAGLQTVLANNPRSFIKFGLSDLTNRLTVLFNCIKVERGKLCHLVNEKSMTPRCKSACVQPYYQQTDDLSFDFNIALKKNFKLSCLIATDEVNMNELLLNLNIYLGINNCNIDKELTLLSYTYLFNEHLIDEPSLIITHENQPSSLIIAYVGGLRKYSYCRIDTATVELLLKYLVDPSKDEFLDKLPSLNADRLTEATMNAILKQKLIPKLKLLCKRSRFSLQNGTDLHQESDSLNKLEGDYLVTLDEEIKTTKHIDIVSSTSFDFGPEHYECFPFHKLSIYANDLNLSTFDANLSTQINNHKLNNTFQVSHIKKLPSRIQKLIQFQSLNLFKNLDMYQYMLSCYMNIIPTDKYIDNHYSVLLKLDLFKSFESIENFRNTLDIESKIVSTKSDQILRHQSSLKSLPDYYSAPKQSLEMPLLSTSYNKSSFASNNSSTGLYTLGNLQSRDNVSSFTSHTSIMRSDHSDEFDVDSELDYYNYNNAISLNYDSGNSIINKVILVIIRLKRKVYYVSHDVESYGSTLEECDSYQKDTSRFIRSRFNEYQYQFERDFDKILSFFYFCLIFVSLFISGIEIGIIYSIIQSQLNFEKFPIQENLGLILIIVAGLIVSTILSSFSLLLVFRRFNSCPISHYVTITIGNLLIIASLVWCMYILFF